MAESPTLLLFPGLGTDARLYGPLGALPGKAEVVQWIAPESLRESLAHYAERLARSVGARSALHVGGVSLGAMVALEAAPWLRARSIFLIGGCRSYHEIALPFRALLAVVATMPERWIGPSLMLAPAALKLFERLTPEQICLMTTMLREHSPLHIQWSCRALLRWECCGLPLEAPIHGIHGELDEVIPVCQRNIECVVAGARHLVSLSHPLVVSGFIRDRL